MTELFLLNDDQWAMPLLPQLDGKPRVDDRRIISSIVHRFREDLRWRELPEAYGPRTTVFNRFNRWSKRRLWQQLFAALAACEEPPSTAMVDSTAVGTHRSAAGAKEGSKAKPSAARVAGARPKIHALCDAQDCFYALLLTGGQVHDIKGALLAIMDAPGCLIGDKAYDANDLCTYLAAEGTTVVISPMPTRRPVRHRGLQDAQHHRACLQPTEGLARHCQSVRQDCPQLPRGRLPCRHRHLLAALRPNPSRVHGFIKKKTQKTPAGGLGLTAGA